MAGNDLGKVSLYEQARFVLSLSTSTAFVEIWLWFEDKQNKILSSPTDLLLVWSAVFCLFVGGFFW